MKILSSLTHPQLQNLYEFLSCAEHKRAYFLRMLGTKQFLAPTDFHTIFFSTKQETATVSLTTFFKISSFMLNRGKKLHRSLEQLEGE